MADISVFSKLGKEIKKIEINADVFDSKINTRLLEMVIRLYANNKRTGNAHTKTRGEVSGGGKRPWKQKGTGRARSSSIRNPLWRGGGTIFGPRKRDIYNIVPRKMRTKALISALSKKYKDNKIVVVDDLSITSPKTRDFYSILSNLKIDARKTLFVARSIDDTARMATRNIENLSMISIADVNAYNIMKKNIILVDADGINQLVDRVLTANNINDEAVVAAR